MEITTKEKIVFILSSTRSGSTWLAYVLGSHSESAFLGEYYRGWEPSLRVPCSWCLANGQETCPVLSGFESVPVNAAFDFAFDRVRRPILIDTSKVTSWAARFLKPLPGREIRLIHLIRDPRGWYESERRRHPLSLPDLLQTWVAEQNEMQRFLKSSGVPSMTVFYDELAAQPEAEFPYLCSFIGMPFEPLALRYWERPHHGFAANGASSFLLRQAPKGEQVTTTGDDAFYTANQDRIFADTRWRRVLSQAEIDSISAYPGVADLLHSFGRSLEGGGLARDSS